MISHNRPQRAFPVSSAYLKRRSIAEAFAQKACFVRRYLMGSGTTLRKVHNFGLGGGGRVRDDGQGKVTFGSDSAGYRLTEKALVSQAQH